MDDHEELCPVIVPFGISGNFGHGSDPESNADALKILLETLIALDQVYLRRKAREGSPVPFLYDAEVRYGRTQSWDTIPDLYEKGVGDCKSLSACFIAQMREVGHHAYPVFRFKERPDGGTDYHILVMTDGKTSYRGQLLPPHEDPSKRLGMTDRFPQ